MIKDKQLSKLLTDKEDNLRNELKSERGDKPLSKLANVTQDKLQSEFTITSKGQFLSNHLNSKESKNQRSPLVSKEDRIENKLRIGNEVKIMTRKPGGNKNLNKGKVRTGKKVETCRHMSNLDLALDNNFPDKNQSRPIESLNQSLLKENLNLNQSSESL